MKKIFVAILGIFLFICMAGCSNTKVLKCSKKIVGNDMNIYQDVEYTFKNDKLVKQYLVSEFKDITANNVEQTWDTQVEKFTKQNEPIDVDGFKRTVESDDKNHTFKVTMEIDYTKTTDQILKNYGIDTDGVDEVTYEELKQFTLKDEYTISCK
ncbi:MAG: hypothetical protein ACI4VL_03600 [Bacilli bacterium]